MKSEITPCFSNKLKEVAVCRCGTMFCIIRGILLTSLCPRPGNGAAAPQAGGAHEEAEQTRTQAVICGAGEELSLGCVYRQK